MTLLSGDDVPLGATLGADLCIVGAGAAGIALALRARTRGRSILLMEAGDSRRDEATQSLYVAELADAALHTPGDRYRERRLGGSTATWGGRCVPFDPIDFDRRPWAPGTDWPIGYEALARHYEDANELCEVGEFAYDAPQAGLGDSPLPIEGFRSASFSVDALERASPPTRFWRRYGERLRHCADVTVCRRANCVELVTDPRGTRVVEARFRTLRGNAFSVAARRFVVACGGLESARLLLASDRYTPGGIGSVSGQLGRNYMCHIAGTIGTVTVRGKAFTGYVRSREGVYCRRRFALRADVQRAMGLSNFAARLHFPDPADPGHRTGFLSLAFLARGMLSFEYGIRLRPERPTSARVRLEHLRNLALDAPALLVDGTTWLVRRHLAYRRLPSVVVEPRSRTYRIDFHAEQLPRGDSRVSLAESVDALGMRRLRIDWRHSHQDIDSVARSLALLRSELARCGAASFEFDPEQVGVAALRDGAYGGHHIGTVRMSRNAQEGVVDAEGRVHGCENLYVTGAAVFPSSSQANPTLTVVAFAVRLAEHLKSSWKSGEA